MIDKKIRLFSFGNSKGDYSWRGGAPGGLLSVIKNQQSGELYLLSCSFVFNELFIPQDYCACSVWRRNFYSVKVENYFWGRSAGFMLR
jgi:hypothetical protein